MKNIQKIAQEILEDNLTKVKQHVEKVADYLEKKIPEKSTKKSGHMTGDGFYTIAFDKRERDGSYATYAVQGRPDYPEEVWLDFYEEKIIVGESLADPRKTYESTSAHYFTRKKRKLKKDFENENKALKAIDKFFKEKK